VSLLQNVTSIFNQLHGITHNAHGFAVGGEFKDSIALAADVVFKNIVLN
jgi:hypothetical protein